MSRCAVRPRDRRFHDNGHNFGGGRLVRVHGGSFQEGKEHARCDGSSLHYFKYVGCLCVASFSALSRKKWLRHFPSFVPRIRNHVLELKLAIFCVSACFFLLFSSIGVARIIH